VPRLVRLIFACALASAIVLSAAASAMAAGWLPLSPAVNASGGTIRTPRVAVDDAGDVFAVWVEGGTVVTAKRPVGGAFETPQTLGPAAATTSVSNPDIGVDGAGNAVAVWTETNGAGAHVIMDARRAAGATSFAAPTTVPNAPTVLQGQDNPRLAVNRAGQAVLVVKGSFNTDGFVRASLGTSTTAFASSREYDIVGNPTLFPPDVAINEAGDAVAIWRSNAGSTLRVDAGYRVHGAGFGPVENVPAVATTGRNDPSVAIDALGNAVAVWNEDPSTSGKVRAFARPPGAGVGWAQLNDLDAGQAPTANFFPQVAFDASNAAVAAWAGAGELRDSVMAPGASMQFAQPPQTLAPATEAPFGLAFDSGVGGTAALVWSRGSDSAVRAAVRPSGGAFGPIASFTDPTHTGDHADVAVDPLGNAAAVWIDTNPADKTTRLVTNEYDATVPGLVATVPSSAVAGAVVPMSADATDDWSAPAIAWDFGDGQSATGAAVSHAYKKGGTYTVTATATDAGGNSTTSTDTIRVVASVPPPKIGETFNAATVSGRVLVSVPKGTASGRTLARKPVRGAAAAAISPPRGYAQFRPLGKNAHIRVGAILDASRGITQISMAANKTGTKLQKGKFSKGVFLVKQTTHSPLTSAEMMGGGNFRRDCRRPRGKLAAARRRPHRQLFAHVRGRFRTRGRHSTATVRGTKYLVKDSCKGTLTLVTQGRVVVRDFRKHRTVVVRAGHRYLAAQ
jgi:PKD repeat protein